MLFMLILEDLLSLSLDRVHAKGVVLCERTCFCLLSALYETLPSKNLVFTEDPIQTPSKNPSKNHLLLENLLRTRLRVAFSCMTPLVYPIRTTFERAALEKRYLQAGFKKA